MNFTEIMHAYFHGEKFEAWWFIFPAGLALLLLGVTALKAEKGGFAWGVAVPCFLFGAILIVTGLTVGLRTSSQVAALDRAYAEDPVAMVREELPRMEKVNANFRATFYAFGGIVFLALLLHYLVTAEWGRAVGAVCILAGGMGLLIDGFAERRAVPYTEALQAIQATQASDAPAGVTAAPLK